MKRKYILIIVSSLVVILVIKGFSKLYTYVGYRSALNSEADQWLNDEFIPVSIEGVIHEFNDPYGDNCFSNLIVKKQNGDKFASSVCSCNEDDSFRAFAMVGDSIVKLPDSKRVIVKKANGEFKEFDFPFCDL